MVLVDAFFSMVFFFGIIFHIVEDKFSSLNDKVIESIIGIGLTVIIMMYCIFDGIRFIDSPCDQIIYVISCILQKPILLPMLMPGRFKSPEAT
jgi:hypothetical protein